MQIKLSSQIKKLFTTGFFHNFGSNVINKIISFLSTTILVRILTKGEYGIFTYTWNIYSIIILANGFGMESAILQLCSEKSNDEKKCSIITSYGTRFGLTFNILLCAIITIISVFIPLAYNGSNGLMRSLCLLPIFQLIYLLICVVLRYQKKNKEYSTLSVINTSVMMLGSVLGAYIFREKGLVYGYYVAYVISIFVGTIFFKVRLFSNENNPEEHIKKDLVSIAFVSMVNNGISELLYLLDVFLLGIVASEETILASYKVATIIPTALNFIPLSLMVYLYPYFAEHKDDGRWCLDRYKKVVIGFGSFNLFISMIMVFGADFIITIIFGNQYIDAVSVFRILAINYFISGTFRIISGNLLVTQRKLKFNTLVAALSGLVNVVADFYMIQWWGSIGAALATILVVVVSSVMSTSYLIYTFRKKCKN